MATAQVRTDLGRPAGPGGDGELRSVAQLAMLHSLAAKLNGLRDPKQIGEAITAELRTIIEYHNCRVFVLQSDGETLVPVAFRGELSAYQGETYAALVTRVGRGLTGHVAETRASYYASNASDDPFAITIPGTPDIEESMLAVPLLSGEALVGVIVLSKLGVDQFDGEDQRLLEVLASHAAVAIENARLLQSERESATKAREEIERALRTEREATQRLRDLDDMKNTFLQAVSHDLRTPLASVLGLALTLNRDLGLRPEEKRDLTERLAANARKLDRILSNLLDLDRLLRGVVEPTLEEADVGSLVRRVVAEADFLAGHRIKLDVLPVRAVIDSPKVERIVENLLVNAVKHTPAGTPVWVSVAPCEGGVLIAVEDAGPGVREDLREAIFEPFRQAESQNPSPGAGIGLSLVSRFAELHTGRAWVEPREGGGSSFRVFLPRRQPAGPGKRRG